MDIERKIKEIHAKPDHIRMRYVFVCVGVSMVVILTIWMVTLKQNLEKVGSRSDLPAVKGVQENYRNASDEFNEMYDEFSNVRTHSERAQEEKEVSTESGYTVDKSDVTDTKEAVAQDVMEVNETHGVVVKEDGNTQTRAFPIEN